MATVPHIIVVGGPNGSGKTTFANDYSQAVQFPYLSADDIAHTLSPGNPSQARVAAGREALHRLRSYCDSRQSLVVESTLSGLTLRNTLRQARQSGYMVTIMYLIVDSVDTCVSRVKERVRKGGHDVPESDIRRRYVRSMSNFWSIYRALADQWLLVYNGTEGIREIAIGDAMHSAIRDPLRWSSFMDQVRKDGDE